MITERQKRERRRRWGGSDMPALLDCDDYGRRPADVVVSKQYELEDRPTVYHDIGNVFEPFMIAAAKKSMGPGRKNQFRVCDGIPLAVHLDYLLSKCNEPVECKNVDAFSPVHRVWGEAGTDEVPPGVNVQIHAQMMCLGDAIKVGHVVAALGGRGIVTFHVERDERVCEAISQMAPWAWEHWVVNREPIIDMPAPSLDVLKRIKRQPDTVVDLDENAADAIAKWQHAKERRLEWKHDEDERQARVLELIGDAEAGRLPDGRLITYMETKRKGYVVSDTTYRTLRLKEA